MAVALGELVPGVGTLTLENDRASVTILPDKGADIYAFVDARTGVDVLFKAPWGPLAPGPWPRVVSSAERWIEAYAGGWQVLVPNGGAECVESGVTWGFHGEAGLAPWTVGATRGAGASLSTRLLSAPLRLEREVDLDGPVLRIVELVTNESPDPVEFMWSHHPAFGPPFIEADCRISAGCRTVLADDPSPGTVLAPGSRHLWPHATDASGAPLDLARVPGPEEERAVLAYLVDFEEPFFAITNPRLSLGVGLRWPIEVFNSAWLWEEVHSGEGFPWFRRAYVIAVEPASTIPAQGMAVARAKGSHVVRLEGRASREVVIEAVLFEGSGDVAGIGEGGVVAFAAT